MRYCGGTAAPEIAAGGIPAGNCHEAFLSAVVSKASSFKGNLNEGLSKCDMMTEAKRSAAAEIRHANREIESRVNKFAQNQHVPKLVVEAVEEGLDTCSKQVRFFVLRRLRAKVRYVGQCFFILQ